MKKRIRISDHALVRYAERVLGVDLDPLRLQLAHELEEALDKAEALDGASAVIIRGYRFVLEDRVVVTVLEQSRPDIRTGYARGRRGERDG